MRDFAQALRISFEDLWSQHEWIATRKQYITDLRCAFEIFDLHLEILA